MSGDSFPPSPCRGTREGQQGVTATFVCDDEEIGLDTTSLLPSLSKDLRVQHSEVPPLIQTSLGPASDCPMGSDMFSSGFVASASVSSLLVAQCVPQVVLSNIPPTLFEDEETDERHENRHVFSSALDPSPHVEMTQKLPLVPAFLGPARVDSPRGPGNKRGHRRVEAREGATPIAPTLRMGRTETYTRHRGDGRTPLTQQESNATEAVEEEERTERDAEDRGDRRPPFTQQESNATAEEEEQGKESE